MPPGEWTEVRVQEEGEGGRWFSRNGPEHQNPSRHSESAPRVIPSTKPDPRRRPPPGCSSEPPLDSGSQNRGAHALSSLAAEALLSCCSPLSRLKVPCCHCFGSGCYCGLGSDPGLSTSTCCGHGQKHREKKKEKGHSVIIACHTLSEMERTR